MRTGGIFHPNWFYAARPAVESAMIARVEIYRPVGVPEWDGGTEMEGGYVLMWRSKARIQPNKDWRARVKDVAGEYDAVHAMRVQVPMDGNELDSVESVDFAKDFMVRVIRSDVAGTEDLVGQEYFIRNASLSTNAWVHNLLCDFGTRQNGGNNA